MDDKTRAWIENWLDSVASNGSAMSQRAVSSLDRRGVRLSEVSRMARKRGVHLLLIEDEHGRKLIAASVKPFKVLC